MLLVPRILLLSLLALPFAAAEVRAENTGPCAAEIAKFCLAVKPGGGRLVNCLRGHEQELSPPCLEHQAIIQRKARKVPSFCQDDVEKFCMEVRPVDRRIMRCLQQNETELSSECREKINEGK